MRLGHKTEGISKKDSLKYHETCSQNWRYIHQKKIHTSIMKQVHKTEVTSKTDPLKYHETNLRNWSYI